MRLSDKYKITIEDESHLTEVASGQFTRPALIGFGIIFILICLLISGTLIMVTPLRTLLPGYLKESQRSATEESLLRLDSLIEVSEKNKAFIDNYLKITNIDRQYGDSASVTPVSRDLSTDSIISATGREQRFVSQMEERERFNISVLAPLAADGVLFSPVVNEGVFVIATRGSENPKIIMTAEESVMCAADGTVIGMCHAGSDGYNITVQHNRGFVTSYYGVGAPVVSIGDRVNGGQVIALSSTPDSMGRRCFSVRMWHNGIALAPYEYLGSPKREQMPAAPYEAPRGR